MYFIIDFDGMTGTRLVLMSNSKDLENLITEEMIANLYSDNTEEQLISLKGILDIIRDLDLEWSECMDRIVKSDIITRVVELLNQNQYSAIQRHSLRILYLITSNSLGHTQAVADAGAVPHLLALLESEDSILLFHTIEVLKNIWEISNEWKDNVLSNNGLKLFIRLLNKTTDTPVILNSFIMMSKICTHLPVIKNDFEVCETLSECFPIGFITKHLFHTDVDVLKFSFSFLTAFIPLFEDKILSIIDNSVCNRIVELLLHNNCDVVNSALTNIYNMLSRITPQIQVIIDCNALPILCQLLAHNNVDIRLNTCSAIYFITFGTQQQIQSLIDENIIPVIIKIITTDEIVIRKRAQKTICNIIRIGSVEQMKCLINMGCIEAFCELLTETDTEIIYSTLECIEKILESGELMFGSAVNEYTLKITDSFGVDRMKSLGTNEDMNIRQLSSHLIERYFIQSF